MGEKKRYPNRLGAVVSRLTTSTHRMRTKIESTRFGVCISLIRAVRDLLLMYHVTLENALKN
jgi:hypothetical protein